MQESLLPLPPFGLVVEAYQKESVKLKNPIYLFVGKNSFEKAKLNKSYGVLSLCLPYQKSLDNYRWPIVGQKIILTDTGGMSVLGMKKMCHRLLQLGAQLICLYSEMCAFEIFYSSAIKKDIL